MTSLLRTPWLSGNAALVILGRNRGMARQQTTGAVPVTHPTEQPSRLDARLTLRYLLSR